MRLTLIVPGLNARVAEAANAPAVLQRLARYARAPVVETRGIDSATLEALAAPGSGATAPLRALGAGLDAGADFVAAADPVVLTAGRDDVVLERAIFDLDTDETAALLATLNAHFAADGLAFVAPRSDAWFVRSAVVADIDASPLDAVAGRPILAHLPRGADGKTWQRWQNEIQMMLFEHPVNTAREARGAAPVGGLWFWGGGRGSDVAVAAPPGGLVAHAADGRAGDLVRGIARAAGTAAAPLPIGLEALSAQHARTAERVLVALPPPVDAPAMSTLTEAWVAPAVRWLERGHAATLDLVTDGHGAAAWWRAERPKWLQRVVVRWRGGRFIVPDATLD